MLGVLASRKTWRQHAAPLGFLLAHFLGVGAFFVTARYRLAASSVLTLYAPVGIRQLVVWARARDVKKLLASTAGLAALGLWLHAFEPELTFASRFESLVWAYENQGGSERALASYDAALAISGNRPYANYEKGRVLQELGRAQDTQVPPARSAPRTGHRKPGIGTPRAAGARLSAPSKNWLGLGGQRLARDGHICRPRHEMVAASRSRSRC